MNQNAVPERTLTLLRHAKSSWKENRLTDVERPLSKRGRRDAVAMAGRIVEYGGSFATIFASPARRTQETVFRMLSQLPAQEARLVFDTGLYTFDGQALLEELKTLDDSLLDVMVVGHNPALHEAIEWLTGVPLDAFPTAACAQLTLSVSRWAGMKKGCARLEWVLVPQKNS